MRRLVALALLLTACHGEELERLRAENAALKQEAEALRTELSGYHDVLREANRALSDATMEVSNVHLYAYGDCASLRGAVLNMQEPEEVDAP